MIKQVQFEGPVIKSSGSRGKSGGSKFGSIAGAAIGGTIGGLAAGAATGGMGTAQGAMMGAGAGAGLGGMVGNLISPAKAAQEAMSRRVELSQPQMAQSESSQKLRQSILALHQAPQPVRDEYGPQLVNAYLTSLSGSKA